MARANGAFIKPGETIPEGVEASLILDRTNFYAEQGGQVHDTGVISKGENVFVVNNVQQKGGYALHFGKLDGEMKCGDSVMLEVDEV